MLKVNSLRAAVRAALFGSSIALVAVSSPALLAQTANPSAQAEQYFDIPAGDLGVALTTVAAQAQIPLAFDPLLTFGKQNPAVNGEYAPLEVINRLLEGSGLYLVAGNDNSYYIEAAANHELGAVSVTAPSLIQTAPRFAAGQVETGARLGVLGNQQAKDTPFSIVSYTAQVIEDQQLESIGDVLSNDASVQSGFGYGNYSEIFMVRGFNLYSDEISYGGLYGILPRQLVSTNPVGSVQLLKGANAFANGVTPGNSGIGGAINIEPKIPTYDYTRLTLDTTAQGRTGVSGDVARRFGDHDQYGAHASVLHRAGDTAIDDENREETSINVGIDYREGKIHTALEAGYQKLNIEGGRSVVYQGSLTEIPDAPSADTNYAPSWASSELENTFAMATADYQLSENWLAHGALGVNHNKEYGDYSSPTPTDNEGNATLYRLSVPYESDTVSTAFGLKGDVQTGNVSHDINLGFSSFDTKVYTAYTMSGNSATNLYDPADVDYPATLYSGGSMDDPNIRSRTTAQGLALSDTLGFLDDTLLVTVGARYQQLRVKNYSYAGVKESDYDENAISPVYGVVYKVTPSVSLYANHVESLQKGDTAPSTASNNGEVFEPYKAKQNEVGVKYESDDLATSLAVYEIKKPSAYTENGTYGVYGEQVNRGLEVSVFGSPANDIRLNSSFAWTDAELTSTQNGTNDGNQAVGVAKYSVVLGGEYDLPIERAITLGGKIIHTGPQYLDAGNTLKLDPWTRLDLSARYETQWSDLPLTWRLNITNVTNEAYWASAAGGYLSQGDPREIKLSVSTEF